MSSLSWQYALLLPCCVWPNSSPASSIGVPCEKSSVASKLRFCRSRSDTIPGSSVVAFGAAVPREVVRVAVAVVFAVRFVVLVVVGDEIVQREAVVRGDEIDARPGLAAALD